MRCQSAISRAAGDPGWTACAATAAPSRTVNLRDGSTAPRHGRCAGPNHRAAPSQARTGATDAGCATTMAIDCGNGATGRRSNAPPTAKPTGSSPAPGGAADPAATADRETRAPNWRCWAGLGWAGPGWAEFTAAITAAITAVHDMSHGGVVSFGLVPSSHMRTACRRRRFGLRADRSRQLCKTAQKNLLKKRKPLIMIS